MRATQLEAFDWTSEEPDLRVQGIVQALIREQGRDWFVYTDDTSSIHVHHKTSYFTDLPVDVELLMRAVNEVFGVAKPQHEEHVDKPEKLVRYILRNKPKAA